jgi:flagella basal body P-ring formation protein FlgA
MRFRYIKIFLWISFLAGFSVAGSQDVFSKIKHQTQELFCRQLKLNSAEIKITFKSIPHYVREYANKEIEVYSQKKRVKPGSQTIWVKFSENSRLLKKIPINITVTVYKSVLVSTEQLNRGSTINAENITFESRNLGKDWDQYFFSLEEIDGMETKQIVKSGIAFTRRLVRQKPMVHRGHPVKIEIRSKNLTIAMQGMAKQDGASGEEVKFQVSDTGKIISGIVEAEDLVVVYQE